MDLWCWKRKFLAKIVGWYNCTIMKWIPRVFNLSTFPVKNRYITRYEIYNFDLNWRCNAQNWTIEGRPISRVARWPSISGSKGPVPNGSVMAYGFRLSLVYPNNWSPLIVLLFFADGPCWLLGSLTIQQEAHKDFLATYICILLYIAPK